MKTLYIGNDGPEKVVEYITNNPGRYFVIGVKGEESDLDIFEDYLKVERLNETYNPKYINPNYYNEREKDMHILQPAFLSLKEK